MITALDPSQSGADGALREANRGVLCKGRSAGGRVWLMSDGDNAGRHCADTALAQVAPHRSVRWVVLDTGNDRNDYAHE